MFGVSENKGPEDKPERQQHGPTPFDLSQEAFDGKRFLDNNPQQQAKQGEGADDVSLTARLATLFSGNPFREAPDSPDTLAQMKRCPVTGATVKGRGTGNKLFKFSLSPTIKMGFRTFANFSYSLCASGIMKVRSVFGLGQSQEKKSFSPPMVNPADVVRFTHESEFFTSPFKANPLKGIEAIHEKYGDYAVVIAPTGHRMLFAFHPSVAKHVLGATDKSRQNIYEKSFLWRHGGGDLTGQDAVIFASGEPWKSRHSVMKSQFGRTLFEKSPLVDMIHESLSESIGELKERIRQNGGKLDVDLSEEMALITLRAGLSALFSMEPVSQEQGRVLRGAFKELFETAPSEAMIPTRISLKELGTVVPALKPLKDSYQTLNAFADWIIDSRLNGEGGHHDLLDIMIRVTDSETGKPLDRTLLRQEVLTMASAVYETTSTLLSWAIPASLESDAVMQKIYSEVDTSDTLLEGLSALEERYPYLDAVVQETLRMYPSLWAAYRAARIDDTIETPEGTIDVPAGTQVVLSPYITQRRGEQWDKSGYPAEEFVPDRWDPDHIKALGLKADDLRVFSFGHGTRVCMGKHFARLEAISVLAHMFKEFTIEPQFKIDKADMLGHFSLQRKGEFPVVLSIREDDENTVATIH